MSDVAPPIRSAAELLPHSAWAAATPGLGTQVDAWLTTLPVERARLGRQARALATPALHPAGLGRLAQVGGRLMAAAAGWVAVDLGRAVYRAVVFGERDDARVGAALGRAERLVRQSGPVYVKLGQFISTAQGLLPDAVVEAFAWCRDDVPPVPPALVRSTVERSLARSIDDLFDTFSDVPIASASIAQVHRARLRDTGQEVAVKVRRPGLRRQFEADIRAMALLAAVGEARSSGVRAANARGFVELFAQLVLEEMDFRLEALNMVEIGLASEDAGMFGSLRIPRPVPGLVTPRVLVMEYLPGRPYTDAAGHLGPDVDPAAIIRLGIQGVLEHTLVYGIFHGDLHAGNVFLEPDGRFVLLDFGIVGRLDARQRAALVQFMLGVGTFDVRLQLDALRRFGAIPAETDVAGLAAALEALTVDQPPSDVVTHEQIVEGMSIVMHLLVAHGFRLPKELVLFFKNLLYLNGLAATLAPDLNLLGEVDPIFQYFAAKYEQELTMFERQG
ncbi:MAG: AarF/ABC1/UbiB kinase family protein [Acidimicrobiia bacterium]|nr:AarF/ABC1/UbiB kinase family protein [Acidimicrobiia bacterium]